MDLSVIGTIEETNASFFLDALLAASEDATVVHGLDRRVLRASVAAERLCGLGPGAMDGLRLEDLFAPDRAGEASSIVREIARGERIEQFETAWRADDEGAAIAVTLSVRPVTGDDGRVLGGVAVARPVAERRAPAARPPRAADADVRALVLDTANQVALDILAHRAGVEALRHIADAARALAGARYAALGVARPDGKGLMEFLSVGLTPEQEAAIGPLPRGVGVLGHLLHQTEPLRIDNLSEHPASAGFPPNHPPMESFLGVPIRRGDTILGSLYLTNKENGQRFTEADEAAVQALGAHAAVAIHNLQMIARQRALLSGLIKAQEEERRAVAYELHDGLTQYVMAAHAHLQSYGRAQETGNEARAAREMDQTLRYLKDAVLESRRLVNGLRALALDDLGLAGALDQLLSEERTRAGWKDADLLHNVAGRHYDKLLETAAFRVVQEALNNVRKHARAERVRVLLLAGREERTGAPNLTLEVRDWGCGFRPEETMGDYDRVGLHGMQERVALLGGSYDLRSAPGEGTTVRAVFPTLETPPGSAEGEDGL